MKILLLGGGTSLEREVSLRSAAAVKQALVELGHEVVEADPRDGRQAIMAAAKGCAVALPMLHGTGGEDGTIQSILEAAELPYLGAGVTASQLCIDKIRVKGLFAAHGILTPEGAVVTPANFANNELQRRPFVLKPIDGGSSLDMIIARKLPYDTTKAAELLAKYGRMLLEELIEGVEITVPVLGDKALPVVEIVPPDGLEFDYENKYNGKTAELCPPKNVSAEQQEAAQKIAVQVHQLAGVRHLSRTDMMVSRDGKIYALEINTMPGMTPESLTPKSAAVAGMSWNQFVAKLVELASGVTAVDGAAR